MSEPTREEVITLCKNIKRLRLSHNLSGKEFGFISGLCEFKIHMIEEKHELRYMKSDNLSIICRHFKVGLDQLYDENLFVQPN